MKTVKKTLAVILLMSLISASTRGLTYMVFNEWRIGLFYTLAFYACVCILALIGAIKMLIDYVFNNN